mmetsp:Transcript_12847/g.23000  ORF Transcript_12847/g.23000 Transcript_12847/m.23000 type:complete len:102 (-) Transcript_12847:154-459(-)
MTGSSVTSVTSLLMATTEGADRKVLELSHGELGHTCLLVAGCELRLLGEKPKVPKRVGEPAQPPCTCGLVTGIACIVLREVESGNCGIGTAVPRVGLEPER